MAVSIEDLPPEILLEIFSHYIESEGHMLFSENVVPVCELWKELSSAPSLWKKIEVQNWDFLFFLGKKGLLHGTESLKICEGTVPPIAEGNEPVNPFHLWFLLSYIQELKSLEILHHSIDSTMMFTIADKCPNLEHLHLNKISLESLRPIPFQLFDPILSVCGPKLKYLQIVKCELKESKKLVAEIAAKCTSLEKFEWGFNNDNAFPIYKLMSGCSQLRELKIKGCKLVVTRGIPHSGFENLKVFIAQSCFFGGFDVCWLLKNCRDMKHVELSLNHNMRITDVSMIPSKNVSIAKRGTRC